MNHRLIRARYWIDKAQSSSLTVEPSAALFGHLQCIYHNLTRTAGLPSLNHNTGSMSLYGQLIMLSSIDQLGSTLKEAPLFCPSSCPLAFWLSALYLPQPDPARRPGIALPRYRQHVRIWSCCRYCGRGWVQLSKKPHNFVHLAVLFWLSALYEYLPQTDPARRPGIAQPQYIYCTMYMQHVLFWSCCRYSIGGWVQLSKKPHNFAHLALINLWGEPINLSNRAGENLCLPLCVTAGYL